MYDTETEDVRYYFYSRYTLLYSTIAIENIHLCLVYVVLTACHMLNHTNTSDHEIDIAGQEARPMDLDSLDSDYQTYDNKFILYTILPSALCFVLHYTASCVNSSVEHTMNIIIWIRLDRYRCA